MIHFPLIPTGWQPQKYSEKKLIYKNLYVFSDVLLNLNSGRFSNKLFSPDVTFSFSAIR
jgi:hypothetical protein